MAVTYSDFAVSVAGTGATEGGAIAAADGVVIAAAGEFDMASAPLLEAAVREAVAARAARIVIDLGAVTFIDAAGLRALIALRGELGQRLEFGSVSDPVQRLVSLTASAKRLGRTDIPATEWPRETSPQHAAAKAVTDDHMPVAVAGAR